MMFDVFISYSRKDSVIADRICEAFDQAGISYFIDRQEIVGGEEFTEKLANAILNSKLFLFLASNNSYSSKYTKKEILYALGEKPTGSIIPYIIDGSDMPNGLRLTFSDINIRSAKNHPINVLVNDIKVILNKGPVLDRPLPKRTTPIFIASAIVVLCVLTILFIYGRGRLMFPSQKRIMSFVELYRDATNNNNIEAIEFLYAPVVKRFYNYYDIERDSVINCYRRYEKHFGAHNPQSAIQWETLKYEKTKDGLAKVSYEEFYSIDRDDSIKPSLFVIEKHFLLNKDYQIIKEFEDIIKR